MNNLLYKKMMIEDFNSADKYTLIYAPNKDKRSFASIYKLKEKIIFDRILEIRYSNSSSPENVIKDYSSILVSINSEDNKGMLENLKKVNNSIWENKILIDISGIKTPDLFTLLKYIKLTQKIETIETVYSMPYDYMFNKEPFTSYKSYEGELELCEPIGFSGKSYRDDGSNLIIFLGFEGSLSLKISEECNYKDLILVNNLPSFYSKYKDISVLSNYEIITSDQRILYTPADNPFETVNLLSRTVKGNESVCISPLSTKPVSLGVCMFALNNDNVRILYPISDKYKATKAIDTYRTYVYEIPLSF